MATLPATDRPRSSVLPAALTAVLAALGAGGLILFLLESPFLAIGFAAAGILAIGFALLVRRLFPQVDRAERVTDWSVANVLAEASGQAVAVTDRAGRLVCANQAFAALFDGYPAPPSLPVGDLGVSALGAAGRAAWRDGAGTAKGVVARGQPVAVRVERVGDESLVWHFEASRSPRLGADTRDAIAGAIGKRLGAAGVMLVLLSSEGRIEAANSVFRRRALGNVDAAIEGRDFTRFLITDSRGLVRFEREGLDGNPLRLLQIPFADGDDAPMIVALLDEEGAAVPAIGNEASAQVRALISLLPVPIALVDRDGRFTHMNDAFVRASRVNESSPPLYPGDLVVREDKSALSDAIRRYAGGAAHSADMAVRLAHSPDEPVAMSIAGARGLGDAAVMLSLKDSGEEGKLKRQVAQATKMQAVGQLAGGVAHDFNNILTAIIGHCDLMLMRHSPGDSDYDDIQQIRANSNRAASLTRQLLAFSRQQTLRPQILQLPDVISEVSNLLKRLLGETVELVVKHGRNLGAVRADPGQLEQVVVNLAVNARDAMLSANPSGGGVVTVETYAVSSSEVREMNDDVLPVGDYTALTVSDTGTGIPPEILSKIFEPFFTTKEVGKGTGLGLSTVYGIIKQSGGYIFAESPRGEGARFTIYLPVHAEAAAGATSARPSAAARVEAPQDTWGSGNILLVEDEAMVRAVAERALTRQGYSVLTAEHGEAALELLTARPELDLLISDVVMPTMDGPTMVRHVRRNYPDLPILFMSGYAEEQLRKSIDIANVAFLPKPFSVQQLAQAVRDALGTK